MHEHCVCEHDLKYCRVCDVVYCAKCGREWGHSHSHTSWEYATTLPYQYPPYTYYGDPPGHETITAGQSQSATGGSTETLSKPHTHDIADPEVLYGALPSDLEPGPC